MNILITSDDGPDAAGLRLLTEMTKVCFPSAFIKALSGTKALGGSSMAVNTSGLKEVSWSGSEVKKDRHMLNLRPADLVRFAFYHAEEILPPARKWDLVLCGINHGHNVGFDVYHSGTVGMAMVAAFAFGCPSIAFSQHLGTTDSALCDRPQEDGVFKNATGGISEILRQVDTMTPGECWNINYPVQYPHLGMRQVPVSHYSAWQPPSSEVVPRAKEEDTDLAKLEQGFATASLLQLRVNPTLRY